MGSKSPKTIEERIVYDLRKHGLNYDSFLEKYEMDKSSTKEFIRQMKNKGYNITTMNKDYEIYFRIDNTIGIDRNVYTMNTDRYYEFGMVSDTHLNGKTEKKDALQSIYDLFAERGIKDVYHAGDLGDGLGVYPGQEFFLKNIAVDDQLEYIVKNYPTRKGITTKYLGGNHDLKLVSKVGFDYCPLISAQRPDMEYLGQMNAVIMLNDNIKMEVEHFVASIAKGISYRGYRFLEDYTGTHPDIAVFGHKHIGAFYTLSNTYFFEAGCFQSLTPWAKSKKFSEHIGGWIIGLNFDDTLSKIVKIVPEWIGF